MLYHQFMTNTGKNISKWPHYFPIYERHLSKYVNTSFVLYEIGVWHGGSMQMWKQYFGPFVTIVGIDIDPRCEAHADEQCHVRLGKQGDTEFLQKLLDEFGPPDVVLDDGSHLTEDQCATFDFLYPRLNNNGTYLVEDLHGNYWESHHGGLKKEGTFIEKAKTLVDSLNAYHIDGEHTLLTEFTKTINAICFYDSIAVFEKMRRPQPYSMIIGNGKREVMTVR